MSKMPDTSAPLRDIVEEFKGKNADEMMDDLNKIPFFMTEYAEEEEENPQIEALRALAYEGEPWEIAENFRTQGNDCFKAGKYQDAIQFYTQALDQPTEKKDIRIASLGNRAQANLILKNYRRSITDSSRVLDLDPTNAKAWYRSAKAFLLLDKPSESIACAERGLANDNTNKDLVQLKEQALQRKERLAELEQARKARMEAETTKQRTLELALAARGITQLFSTMNYDKSNPGDLSPELDDPFDANTSLSLPVLALYPLKMESDIMEHIEETVTIREILDQLFSEPPHWADPREYNPDNLDVFAQTGDGGLAKIGLASTLRKAFGNPKVVLVDNMARLFVVPRDKVSRWLKDWNKDAQRALLKGDR